MLDKGIYFGQYMIAFAAVNIILPRLLFARPNRTALSNFFSYFAQMVLFVIVLGYILVILKIFEIIAILCALLFFILGRTFIRKSQNNRRKISKEISFWVYDYADGIIVLPKLIKKLFSEWTASTKVKITAMNKTDIISISIVAAVLAYSGFLRIYDAFVNAAPTMSDAYVTLAWIKYIGKSTLFHDGIYPQGFHIYQAMLVKFAGLDPLFILKFTGPVNGLLIVLGIYFAVSGFLKNKQAGVIAAAAYGIFGFYLTGGWERQASTNAQEFAFIFVLPCLYFFYRYLAENNKQDLFTGGAALSVIGLVHSLVFAFTLFGGIILLFTIFISERKSFTKLPVLHTIGAVSISTAAAVLPFGIGLVLGYKFHSTSLDFATSQSVEVGYPKLLLSDYVVVVCLSLLILSIIGSIKKPSFSVRIFLFLFGAATLCLYYFGGPLSGSVLISSRSTELYSLISPVIIGAGFSCVMLPLIKFKYSESVFTVICAGLLTAAVILAKPVPIIPYKMEYNSGVEQYLRISKNFRATEWLIISQEEGYAMVLGKGWHLMTQDFLAAYDPKNGDLIGNRNDETEINVPDVFIYIEKNVYPTYKNMSSLEKQYNRRIKESAMMQEWMLEYCEINGKQDVYFEDENIIIYHLTMNYEVAK
ncbi:MAG: hypothetical protein ACYCYI_10800 [Saccharofermentanales bacterium]